MGLVVKPCCNKNGKGVVVVAPRTVLPEDNIARLIAESCNRSVTGVVPFAERRVKEYCWFGC